MLVFDVVVSETVGAGVVVSETVGVVSPPDVVSPSAGTTKSSFSKSETLAMELVDEVAVSAVWLPPHPVKAVQSRAVQRHKQNNLFFIMMALQIGRLHLLRVFSVLNIAEKMDFVE